MKLAAASDLGFTVDRDALVFEQVANLSARVDHVGKLEQLAEADRVAANRDLPALHAG